MARIHRPPALGDVKPPLAKPTKKERKRLFENYQRVLGPDLG
jgi:hypothetical protein